MILEQLLEEIKYGKEFVDSKNTIKDIGSFIDEDYDILLVGKRSSALLEGCDNTKSFIKKLNRASRNYQEFENKILEGTKVSSIYAKMKMDSIVEDINASITELDKSPKILRESNKDAVVKTIACLEHGISLIAEHTSLGARQITEGKQVLQSFINKEKRLIEEVL